MTRRIAVAAVVFAAASAIAGRAVAGFTGGQSTSASFAAATLAPASGLALTWTCPPGANRTAQLAWTATPSTFADGYLVDRLDPSTGTVLTSTRTTPSATTFTESVAKKTAVRYRVTATAANWRSASIEVTGTAPAGNC